MANDKRVRKLLNTIGFALADENVGNQVARREAALAHRELLGIFENFENAPLVFGPAGNVLRVIGGDGLASERITAAIPRLADIDGAA